MVLLVTCSAVPLPKNALQARTTFEVGLQVATKEGRKSLEAMGDAYLQQLRDIERDMQVNGQFRDLVAVHDEIMRFAKARVLTGRPVETPVELHDAQTTFQLKLSQANYSNAVELVTLAKNFVQELATARDAESKLGHSSTVTAVDEERDRVIGLATLRRALENTKNPPPAADALTNTTSSIGVETRPRRQIDVYRPTSEPLLATIGYDIKVSMFEDVSRLKPRRADGAGGKMRAVDGLIGYVPHIEIYCPRGNIPSGSHLVIEYFSHSLADHVRHRESVEQVVLPRLDRGESFTMEAKGIQLYRSESVSSILNQGVSRSVAGSEFYGLIVNIVDPNHHVLVQRFTPQSLERELSATPPEK